MAVRVASNSLGHGAAHREAGQQLRLKHVSALSLPAASNLSLLGRGRASAQALANQAFDSFIKLTLRRTTSPRMMADSPGSRSRK
jgi:hypothetical protein